MNWRNNINELRAFIAGLEADLADADAILAMCADRMPKGPTLDKALRRHAERELKRVQRMQEQLRQS